MVTTFLGVAIARLLLRQREIMKLLFNVGKETLIAAAAAFAAATFGLTPVFGSQTPHLHVTSTLLGLTAGAIAYGILDEALSQPLFSIVTHTPLRVLLMMHLDARLLSRAGSLFLAVTTVVLYSVNPWLATIVVPSVYAIHLTSANRVRHREENEAWQRLAQATDELNAVDLNRVLSTAVRRAAGIFSADEVEIEVRVPDGPMRLVRGDSQMVSYDGPPADAPTPASSFVVPIALESYQGDADLGVLRLRFDGGSQAART